MIKIAICDDDKNQLLQIQSYVDDFIAVQGTERKIIYSTFQNGADLLAEKDRGENFDIILLDVVMPFVSGIQLAEEIRATNSLTKIIFLTSSPEYAVDSYRLEAFYYLLKPVKKEAINSVLEKACMDILSNSEKYIVIKQATGLRKIILSQLEYGEIVGHTIYYYLRGGETFKCLGTMQQLEKELLSDPRFIKPHRSYIVNIDFIKNLSIKAITTVGGADIPISRNNYQEIKRAYIDYSFEEVTRK